ncbi:hypothetical protein C8J57DRAFT_1243933 [Mycena rebaudengoi]|nr:hypothetical protein C8J57DRAFT_1243933 [Mycena rebaudengoi]
MKLCRRTGKEGKKRGIAIGRQHNSSRTAECERRTDFADSEGEVPRRGRESRVESKMRGDVVGDGEKPREAGTTQRHTARTVPAAAELGIGAWETRVGRRGREGAGGPAEARGVRCGNRRAGCGDVSRVMWRWGREQGTGGFLGICRENPAEMVSGGAGFVAGSGGFVAGRAGFAAGFGLRSWQGAGGAPGGGGSGRWWVWGRGFAGLPGFWTRVWWGTGGCPGWGWPRCPRLFEVLKLFLADHRSKRKISSYIRHLEPRMSALRWYPWYLYTAILDIEMYLLGDGQVPFFRSRSGWFALNNDRNLGFEGQGFSPIVQGGGGGFDPEFTAWQLPGYGGIQCTTIDVLNF